MTGSPVTAFGLYLRAPGGYRCQKIARQTATMKALSRKPDSFRRSKSQCSAAIRLLARNQAKRGFGIQPST